MILGVLDLGTQSLRGAGVRWDGSRCSRLFSVLRNVRLGRELASGSAMGPEALERAVACLSEVGELFRRFGVERFRGVGTAALRRAADSPLLLQAAAERLPGPLEVISQEEEASLAVRGAVATLPEMAGEPLVVVDIGGGSTEVLIHRPSQGGSLVAGLPLGAVTLHHRLSPSDPPTRDEWRAMEEAVERALEGVRLPQGLPCVGVGGTATLLASLKLGLRRYDPRRIRGTRLSMEELALTASRLLSHNLEERRGLPGMEPERADISIAGLAICVTLLRHLAADGLWVSDGGLLMGLVVDLLEKELDSHAEPSCTAGLYL